MLFWSAPPCRGGRAGRRALRRNDGLGYHARITVQNDRPAGRDPLPWGGYVFAYGAVPGDLGRNVVQPHPKIAGTKSRDDTAMMKTFVGAMITPAREGGGLTAYRWPHPGQTAPAPTVASSLGFEPWQWTITTALFVDDVEAMGRAQLIETLLGLVPLHLVVAVAGILRVRSITEPLSAFTDALRRRTGGEMGVAIAGLRRRDEIGRMAQAAGVSRDGMIQAQTLPAEQQAEQGKREERDRVIGSFDQSVVALPKEVDTAATVRAAVVRCLADMRAA